MVVPDELAEAATRCGLSPAERLTIFGLMRGWNPRRSEAPVVRASLDELRKWTGLSRGHQSEVVAELLDGFDPPLLEVVEAARGREARTVSLATFLRVAAGADWTPVRVPPAERYAAAEGSAGRTLRARMVPPAERMGSAGRTLQPRLDVTDVTTEGAVERVRSMPDAELRRLVMAPREADHAAACEEWARRKSKPRTA